MADDKCDRCGAEYVRSDDPELERCAPKYLHSSLTCALNRLAKTQAENATLRGVLRECNKLSYSARINDIRRITIPYAQEPTE